MSTGKVAIVVALVLTLFTAATVGAAEALTKHQTTQRTLPRPIERVVVTADAGNVKLVAARAQRVTLIERRSWLWRKPHVRARLEGPILRVAADCPHVGVLDRCAANLELRVPSDTDVTVHGGAGDIHADGLAGHVELRTDAGDVSGDELVPVSLDAATNAGDLNLRFATSPVLVRARSDAGDVNITVPAGEYRVDTASAAGSDEVRGVLRNDSSHRRIDARTQAGDVMVRGEGS
jgi:putative adhesin